MKRAWRVATMLVVTLVTIPFASQSQPMKEVPRIGYLSVSSVEGDKSWVAAFRQGLRDLGYIEGETIAIEQRHAGQQAERVHELAAELVRLKVDVFVVYGPLAVYAVKKATQTIPIVFTVGSDPVGAGYVASLARPGGNVTGLSDSHAETVPKRLELLKEVVPSASRIAVLFNPAVPVALLHLKNSQAAAPALGVTILPVEVRGAGEIDRAFTAIGTRRPDGLLIIPDPSWFLGQQRRVADLAVKSRLPAVATVREWADAGGLISYGTNFHELWRRAATYVDKILKGAKPGDLPVEQPTRFELVINLKTAKSLGLTIPPSLLLRADHVIE